jgi:hypothetical protein
VPSYSNVFSVPFIEYADSAPNYTFDVPEGFTAVIRDIHAFCQVGGVSYAVVTQNTGGAPLIYCHYATLTGLFSEDHWEGRHVVPGGGSATLEITSVDLLTTVYVGGYLLRNTLA